MFPYGHTYLYIPIYTLDYGHVIRKAIQGYTFNFKIFQLNGEKNLHFFRRIVEK